MKSNSSWRIRLAQIFLGVVIVIALVVVRGTHAGNEPVHLVTDWSHRHLVFSAPHNLGQHVQLLSNPRYVQQLVRRNAELKQGRGQMQPQDPIHKDWSVFLGSGGTVGPGVFPAKFLFNVATANCSDATQPDFVVYNNSLDPSPAANEANQIGFFTGTPTNGQTFTITNSNSGTFLAVTASATLNTGLHWKLSANHTTDATNLALAIARNSANVGVTASSFGANVIFTSANAGDADNSITLATNMTAFALFGSTLAGGTNGASIVAFDNLYSGCGGTVPSTYWAYDTGGTVTTSVILSGDGSQVAFVQKDNITGTADLVLLKWAASGTDTVNAPSAILTAVSPGSYRSCTAPCMTTIVFSGGATDSNSSPFYDFAIGSDKLYVGDDNGNLHQFNNVFLTGTPAESGSPWPVALTTGNITTSPVYDAGTGKVYIADNGGLLYAVNASTGATVTSGTLALGRASGGLGIVDSPILDSSVDTVYVFAADDSTCGSGSSAVYQLRAGFAAGGKGTSVNVGSCSDSVSLYAGSFDNAYYSSVSSNAGNLYVCGNTGGNPTLYQITITNTGAMGTVATGPEIATVIVTCSPIAEIYNVNATGGAKDWIFMSVQDAGNTSAPISCPSAIGCIMSFDVTSGATLTPAHATSARAAAAGGTSGIVPDNTVGSVTLSGTSQVYYSTLAYGTCSTSGGAGGCGIQASQSGLN